MSVNEVKIIRCCSTSWYWKL